MHELRTTPRLGTLATGERVRAVVRYRHSRLLPCVEVYLHGHISPRIVPTDELTIR